MCMIKIEDSFELEFDDDVVKEEGTDSMTTIKMDDVDNICQFFEKLATPFDDLKITVEKAKEKKPEKTEEKTKEKDSNTASNNDLQLSPPWHTYTEELKAIFSGDPKVKVHTETENDEMKIVLRVEGIDKAIGIAAILPKSVNFGGVAVGIEVKSTGGVCGLVSDLNLLGTVNSVKRAFEGNKNVDDVIAVDDPSGLTHVFVCFKPIVVQFYNDEFFTPHGLSSMLLENAAFNVFKHVPYTHYTTAAIDM